MRSTGIVRRIDDLGRVTIPKDLRKVMGIEQGDSLEIYVNGNSVSFRKYSPGCYICGDAEELQPFHGRQICKTCIKRAAALLKQ